MAEGKTRHGCLTAWLVFMIIVNAATALMYLFGGERIGLMLPDMPGWALPILIAVGAFNLVCAIALLQWKKWGFWGFCATSVVVLVVNLMANLGTGTALLGLVGVLLLYGILQMGTENKGWPQLD